MQATQRLVLQSKQICTYCQRMAARFQAPAVNHVLKNSYSTETIQAPHIEGTEKNYQPKIVKLVDEIGQLNLLEVADLNELLKKTLNIQDAPVMAMGMAAPAAQKEEEEDSAPKKEKVIFNVKLTKFEDGKKIQLIKLIKGIVPDMNLVQAKKFVESVPQIVQSDLSKEDAEKLKTTLEESGASVELE